MIQIRTITVKLSDAFNLWRVLSITGQATTRIADRYALVLPVLHFQLEHTIG